MDGSLILTLVSTVFVSTGFWSFLTAIYTNRKTKQSTLDNDISKISDMVLGLGHDKILYLGQSYIKRGYITSEEYDNLKEYLYLPYRSLGGNGTAERIMNEVEKLPIRRMD